MADATLIRSVDGKTYREWLMSHVRDDTAVGVLSRSIKAIGCVWHEEHKQRECLERHGTRKHVIETHALTWGYWRDAHN